MKVLTTNDFIDQAKQIHGDKYNYSKVNYLNSRTNALIEYDGEQHFKVGAKVGGKHIINADELEKIQYRDNIKTKWAANNKIKLIRINYKNNIQKILQKELL